jgi:transposase
MEACFEPSASVAGLAPKHGVNANLLRKWIKLHQQQLVGTSLQAAPDGTAFVPVVGGDSHEAVVAPESAKTHRHQPRSKDVFARVGVGAVVMFVYRLLLVCEHPACKA